MTVLRARQFAVLLLLAGSAGGLLTYGAATAPDRQRDPAPSPAGNPPGRFTCPPATVTVADGEQLRAALAGVRPGDVIRLRDGSYTGAFTLSRSGSAAAPVHLCGGRAAVLQGGSIAQGYGLHLDRAAHWRIAGFSVRQSRKGIVLDASTDVALQDLVVERIGEEGVHLRRNSSANAVRGLVVRDVGLLTPEYGEGIYIGSARANWRALTGGGPDRSDRNVIAGNAVSATTSEAVDVKEGTTGGLVEGNRFDGAGMSTATAWVNVKGNGWTVRGNRGLHTPRDGFQVHAVLRGWGEGNLFAGNVADLSGSPDGVGVRVPQQRGNTVRCDNTTTDHHPPTNITCVPGPP